MRPDLARARALVAELASLLADDPPPPPIDPIATADALTQALATAAPGATITLASAFVSTTPLVLKQSIRILGAAVTGRMDRATPAPALLGGVTILGDDVTIQGCELRHPDPLATIVTITGARAQLLQNRILGDPIKGARRGIAANGAATTIRQNLIDDCFGPAPGQDTQAICAWDTPGPLTIDDNYLAGGAETVMIGGADPASADRIPSDITITGNTITKNPTWQGKAILVKNVLELKNCRRVRIEGNDLAYAWGGKGQTGYLLMLTVRNQDGRAPYSTIQDVVIRGNTFSHGAAAINVLGRDDIKEDKADRPTPVGQVRPSEPLARVAITGNRFDDLDPARYEGSKRLILIGGGPIDLTIADNVFLSTSGGLSSVVYFQSGPAAQNLIVTGNHWPKTPYGIFGTNATVGKAWSQFVASGALDGNVES